MIKLKGIGKFFPGVVALDGVNLSVGKGEVHALLGENGAGKSTLLKILSGAQPADTGTIEFDGQVQHFHTPQDAQEAGIATIYQEFTLFPDMSIADNIFAGREVHSGGFFIDHSAMRKAAKAVTDKLGIEMNPATKVRDLSVGEQQLVEIARALTMDAKLIIMDEPTAALSRREIEQLQSIIADLKAEGVSVIIVTHRLNEVFECCDRYTILRDGQFITSGRVDDVDEDQIISMMVGRSMESLFERRASQAPGDVVLEIENLTNQSSLAAAAVVLKKISMTAAAGEIVGLAGLVGAGRTDLARTLFGAPLGTTGDIRINGEPVSIQNSLDAIKAGIALVPEDRKAQGLFLDLSCKHNVSVSNLGRISSNGFINEKAENALVDSYIDALNVRLANKDQPIKTLSGGNQQKLLLARWMATNPKVLIVDEPTRGVDIGAKVEVHRLLFEMAKSGVAVIVISSELPEILSVSDRIYTFCEGRLTGEFHQTEANEEQLMRYMSPSILSQTGASEDLTLAVAN
ncbi:sugar ABC transporter ATP-binding protein [Shimia sp. R10_1]|uniref:sugar ABC transporter ATP-binding protein n=1 Tax=Shimia sp. R10_1 TaxID=2821095 RepID=UPI001AD9FD03|nr:sugar ABC transporter ATP-binding protein [Shimia sp. R10_1]MBO9474002.1 sugar ABC transporter ATP-binding protein [Shimia sp. R10_1]